MKNLVISLTSATSRRKHITEEFNQHEVNFEFFDALTPQNAHEYAHSLGLSLDSARLTPKELACMMSHVAIWKKAIDENIPYITVFEDDVYLGKDAKDLLNNDKWVLPDWHIIKIETFAKRVLLARHSYDVLNKTRQVKQLIGRNIGAAGYILSTYGAKRVFDYLHQHRLQPIDEIIFDTFIKQNIEPVYQLTPAICIQEMVMKADSSQITYPSALEDERRQRVQAEKLKGWSKVPREINRLTTHAKELIFATEIPFE